MYKFLLLIAAIELSIFLAGYALGRRLGKKEGVDEGKRFIPLEWRSRLLETSTCPLCSQKLNIHTNCDNIHNRES